MQRLPENRNGLAILSATPCRRKYVRDGDMNGMYSLSVMCLSTNELVGPYVVRIACTLRMVKKSSMAHLGLEESMPRCTSCVH
jgi:hypothetical protein